MTPEKQHVAIATAIYPHFPCYWDGPNLRHRYPQTTPETSGPAHDYLNDLNACHEMEKMLTKDQWQRYTSLLNSDLRAAGQGIMQAICHATAAQRCEAFLKTLELWEESQ